MNKEQSLAVAYAVIALSEAQYIKLPVKARWVAQDRDGAWWWYARKPVISVGHAHWRPSSKDARIDDTHGLLGKGISPADFTQTLYKIGEA